MFWSPLILPYGDNIDRGNRRPWATYAIIAATFYVFVITRVVLLQGESVSSLSQLLLLENQDNKDWLYLTFGLIPSHLQNSGLAEILARMLGSLFLHDSLQHFAGNMIFFWVVGRSVESRFKSSTFLALYLCGGLIGAAAQCLVDMASDAVIVGASGAVWTIAALYLLTFPRARVMPLVVVPVWNIPVFLPNSVPFWLLLVISQVVQSVWSYALRYVEQLSSPAYQQYASSASSIGYFAHLGGAVFGIAVYAYLRWGSGWSARYLKPTPYPVWIHLGAYALLIPLLAGALYWQAVALRMRILGVEANLDAGGYSRVDGTLAVTRDRSSSWRISS